MRKILTFKHWQLFILIVLLGAWTSPSPLKEIINSIAILTFLIWIYSIGIFGQQKIKELGLRASDTGLFRLNILLIPVLIVIVTVFSTETDEFEMLDLILIPCGLYLVFAMFQTIIFAIRTLTTIELKKEAEFGDWILNFILTILLIAGIWILQPKVNEYIGDDKASV